MAHVKHPNVDSNSFTYIGPLAQQWAPNSSIVNFLKTIHDDFLAQPPTPIQVVGAT